MAALIWIAPTCAAAQDSHALPSDGAQTGTTKWVKFSPEGARFSLSLPASPNEKTKDEDAGLKIHYYKLKMGATEYQVVWFANVPPGILQRAPLNVLFPRGLEDMLKSARQAGKKGLITTHEDDIKLNGYGGRESTMESATDRIDAEGFLAGYDFIALAVLHPKDEASAADAKRFLESLSLAVVNPGQTSGMAGSRAGMSPGTEVDTRPIPLNRPRPNYTERARKNGVQGVIRVKALIGVDGRVKEVVLHTHLPDGLDNEAARAVRQLIFKPATKAGQPVEYWQPLEVEFNLRDKR